MRKMNIYRNDIVIRLGFSKKLKEIIDDGNEIIADEVIKECNITDTVNYIYNYILNEGFTCDKL